MTDDTRGPPVPEPQEHHVVAHAIEIRTPRQPATDAEAEVERLDALRSLGLLDTPPEERFDRITSMCTRLFDVRMAALNLIDDDRQFTKSSCGITMGDTPRSDTFCSVAIQDLDVLVVPDARADARFADNPFVTGDPYLRFYAGQPLVGPGGHMVGTLCLFDPSPREMSDGDRALLRDLARWVQEEMLIDDEMERASAVQRGLLPRRTPSEGPWQLVGECRAARDVGGDMYDWYRVRGGQVVTVADVMGKGMPAAIMMATLRATLRAGSRGGDLELAVEIAAETMDEDFGDAGAFATLFHAVLHDDRRTVSYIDAGHGLALVVMADGTTRRLESSGLPVGSLVPSTWQMHHTELDPGDHLVVFSDGLLDLHPGVEETFAAVADAVVADGRPEEIVTALLGHRTSRPDDDQTVLAVRCRA